MEMESNLTQGYQSAYAIARKRLLEKKPGEMSIQTDCPYDPINHTITVKFLGTDYFVNCLNGEIHLMEESIQVTATIKVLILHYLLNSQKRPPLKTLISFREVRGGGANYFPTFYKRAILPLQKCFEKDTGKLIRAGIRLGGQQNIYGDASVTVPVFPLVPVTYAVWQGDEEIPPSATILFDGNITSFLPCEDIVLAASFGTYELMKVS